MTPDDHDAADRSMGSWTLVRLEDQGRPAKGSTSSVEA